MSDLNRLARAAFDVAESKGWWDSAKRARVKGDAPCADGLTMSPVEVTAQLALVVTEVAEAIECVRDDDYEPRENPDRPGKPEGLPSELADVVIRVAQLAHVLGIDLDKAVEGKMDYNAVRKRRPAWTIVCPTVRRRRWVSRIAITRQDPHMAKFTADELWRYLDLQDAAGVTRGDLTVAQQNVDECAELLEEATEADDEASAALASYQAEIEAAATARAST